MAKDKISRLNGLIETCKDAENGYLLASKFFEGTEFADIFKKYAERRHKFTSELQNQANMLGAVPEDSGTVSATLHRGWINIKSMVSDTDFVDILSECKRGEQRAIENYKQALYVESPPMLKKIIKRQYEEIRKALDHIKLLEKGLG